MATEVISREAQQQHPRWPVAATKAVRVDLGPAGAGHIVNVSYGGIRVKSLAPLRREAELPIRIEVPDAMPVLCSGIVVWSKPDGAAGLRFTKLADDQKAVLAHWLGELEHSAGDSAFQRDEFARTTAQVTAMKLNNADALRLIARRVVTISSAAGVAIALGKPENMACLARLGEAPELGSLIRPVGLVGECIRGRKMVVCHDAATDPRAGERKQGSELIVPLLVNGELRGLIQVLSPKAHAFDVKCMETMEKLADAAVFVTHNVMPQRRVASVTPMPKPAESAGSTIMKPSDSGKLKAFSPVAAPSVVPLTPSLQTPAAVTPLPVVSVAEAAVAPVASIVKPIPSVPAISAPLVSTTITPAPSVSTPMVSTTFRPVAEKRAPAKPAYEFDLAEYAKARQSVASGTPAYHPQARRSNRRMLAVPVAVAVVAVPLALYLLHGKHTAVTASSGSSTIAVAPAAMEPSAIATDAVAAPTHAAAAITPTAKLIPTTETAGHEKKASLVEKSLVEKSSPEKSPVENKSGEVKTSREAKTTVSAELEPTPLMIASGVPVARHEDEIPDMPAPAAPRLAMKATTTLPGISLPVTTAAKPIAPTAKPLTGGTLLQRVSPVYPAVALSEGLEGQVQLRAVITAQGAVENIRRISGQPLLTQAAIDAVKHWRYDPFKTGGVPIEGEVTITLNFKIPR